jgi:hypothetical protein
VDEEGAAAASALPDSGGFDLHEILDGDTLKHKIFIVDEALSTGRYGTSSGPPRTIFG